MEQLIQKYIRYFYMTLLGIISMQLLDIIFTTLGGEICCETFILMSLSIINIILLIDSVHHNMKQQFTECKTNTKILRFTIAFLIIIQSLLCFRDNINMVALGNHLMTIIVIEIVLNYRIKSIEYLEDLANRFAKDNALD